MLPMLLVALVRVAPAVVVVRWISIIQILGDFGGGWCRRRRPHRLTTPGTKHEPGWRCNVDLECLNTGQQIVGFQLLGGQRHTRHRGKARGWTPVCR